MLSKLYYGGPGLAGAIFYLGLLAMATVVVVVVVLAVARTLQSRSSVSREEAYRAIARDAADAQVRTAAALADIQPRLVAIEKMLREVG
jgi:Tfp pilus assembly protein PilX